MRDSEKKYTALRVIFFILGALFVICGISRAEHADVLDKAVRICLECIGIG